MSTREWLTCQYVEELQQAAATGRKVESYVNLLEGATLPALLEYGCSRWHDPSLPALPSQIFASPLGRALQDVRSELGLRTRGHQKPRLRSITPSTQEFFVLEGDRSTEDLAWAEFLVRFRQAVKSVGFDMAKANGIAAAFGEMADNASIHASAPVGTLAGYHVVDHACVCSVVDVGIGVLESMASHEAYCHVDSHKDAIRLALQKGVSRFGPGQGGLGFYSVFKALAASSGTLRFRSGEGCISMDGTDLDADRGEESFVVNRPGFQVTICCRTSSRADPFPLI